MKNYRSYTALALIIMLLTSSPSLFAKEKKFLILDPDKISRYNVDRIVFQRVEKKNDESKDDYLTNYTITKDNSVENLFVLKEKKIHFISDGFDSLTEVQRTKILSDSVNKYVPNNDYWVNKINGKPDYIKVIYRRSALVVNSNEEVVTTKFGTFYKSVRDKFIKMHADKFRNLLNNRRESGVTTEKRLISYSVNPENSTDVKQKYFFSAKAKSNDGTVYYCEDADGDGITETFTATRDDGFDWGIDSGPNLLFIMGNSDKELEGIIGKLVKESLYGSEEEEAAVIKEILSEKDIINLVDQVTPIDTFYK